MLNSTRPIAEVLVIDDMPANLKVLSEILSAANYAVAAVTNGKRALKRLQSYVPDLILLDIQMPEMNGFETCQKIKANPDTAHVPIIFITALSDVENIAKGFSLGAVDYICKPFQEKELLSRVKTHLKLQSFTRELEQQVSERTADLQQALEEVEKSKLQMIQQEKMSALGNLIAGVAHEINNPLGFLQGSIDNANNYIQELREYLDTYQSQQPPNESVQKCAEDIDLIFLLQDFPKLLNSMQEATERIQDISTNLRTFSRIDKKHKIETNIHEGLDSTLIILKHRLKANDVRAEIQVVKQYSELPPIKAFSNQLNQVFMNILVNAIDVFDEAAQQTSYEQFEINPQILTIQTQYLDDLQEIQIQIRDNGKGMTREVKEKIFEPLYTTKEADKGTGLGLAIAFQIVIENHGGSLEVESEVGHGTEFYIRLPL